jgi:hypothetical protein
MKRWATAVLISFGLVAGLLATPSGAEVGEDGWDRRVVPPAERAQMLVGDFGGDDASDVLFYRPGPDRDTIWYGQAGGRGISSIVQRSLNITGRYQPIVGDFAGDDGDEILWYAAGSTQDYLWTSTPGTYTFGAKSRPRSVNGDFTWAVLRDERGGKDDVAWIANGDARDYIWHFRDDGSGWPLNVTVSAQGPYELVSGDFDGNGYDDLVLHAPGAKRDELWRSAPQGTVSRTIFQLNRSFDLITIRQSGGDDLLLRPGGPGVIYDLVWEHGAPPFQSSTVVPRYPEGRPTDGISFDTGRVLLTGGWKADYFLRYTNHAELEPLGAAASGPAGAGDFDLDGHQDILLHGAIWYAPAA